MKLPFDRDLCLWIVPSKDGKVRKLRIGLRVLAACSLAGAVVACSMLYVVSDYARVQIQRAKSFLHIQKLSTDRETLLTSNEKLKSKVDNLMSVNGRVLSYERNLKQRVEELSAVIRSASSMGLLPREEKQARKGSDDEGIGGAEIDCDDGSGDRCSSLDIESKIDGFEQSSLVSGGPNSPLAVDNDRDLVEVLDRYIDILKMIPFALPASGHVSSGFGYRYSPFHGGLSMHEGIDFSLSQGSHILATADGIVRQVRRNGTYGLMVDIAHSDSVVTRFAHLSKAFVSDGERVCRGEVIALAGSTGRSTGPHLHYEVLVNGKPRNPAPIITMAQRLSRIFS